MYRKVGHMENLATEAFFRFVEAIDMTTWYSGYEIGNAKYSGKPKDGVRRVVTFWQGFRSGDHQKVEIHFTFCSNNGGWNIRGYIFAGRTTENERVKTWSQAFRGGPSSNQYRWTFTPARYDGYDFKDIDDEKELNELFHQYLCHGRA